MAKIQIAEILAWRRKNKCRSKTKRWQINNIRKNTGGEEIMECSICGMDLSEGWLYYQKGEFYICHFCYDDLELKGDD